MVVLLSGYRYMAGSAILVSLSLALNGGTGTQRSAPNWNRVARRCAMGFYFRIRASDVLACGGMLYLNVTSRTAQFQNDDDVAPLV